MGRVPAELPRGRTRAGRDIRDRIERRRPRAADGIGRGRRGRGIRTLDGKPPCMGAGASATLLVGNLDSADAGASKRFGFGLPKPCLRYPLASLSPRRDPRSSGTAPTRTRRERAAMAPPPPPIPPVPPARGHRSPAGAEAQPDRFAGLERGEVQPDRRPDQTQRQGMDEPRIASSVSPDDGPARLPLPEVPFTWQVGR